MTRGQRATQTNVRLNKQKVESLRGSTEEAYADTREGGDDQRSESHSEQRSRSGKQGAQDWGKDEGRRANSEEERAAKTKARQKRRQGESVENTERRTSRGRHHRRGVGLSERLRAGRLRAIAGDRLGIVTLNVTSFFSVTTFFSTTNFRGLRLFPVPRLGPFSSLRLEPRCALLFTPAADKRG
jgi:hypothetical protein